MDCWYMFSRCFLVTDGFFLCAHALAVVLPFCCTPRGCLSHYILLLSVDTVLRWYRDPRHKACIGHMDAAAFMAAWDYSFTAYYAAVAFISSFHLYPWNTGRARPAEFRCRRHEDAGLCTQRDMESPVVRFFVGRRPVLVSPVVCLTYSGGNRVHRIHGKRNCQEIWFYRRSFGFSVVLCACALLPIWLGNATHSPLLCWRHIRTDSS